jgi:activator of HSP90 ATPase
MELKLTNETQAKLDRFNELKEELDTLFEKEVLPQIRVCINRNDKQKLSTMAKDFGHHSFSMRCYMAMVEINRK